MKEKEIIKNQILKTESEQIKMKKSTSKSNTMSPQGIVEKMAAKKQISTECAQMLGEILRHEQAQLEALHKKLLICCARLSSMIYMHRSLLLFAKSNFVLKAGNWGGNIK